MQSDAELMRAAREDPAAFGEVYERHAARIFGFHRGRCRDEHAALDLTAETFAQAWLSRRSFHDLAAGSAGPWLFGIARHVLSRSVRQERLERAACDRLGVLERLDQPASAAVPDETWLEGLDEYFESLPDEYREAISLRVVDDHDYEEIAKRTGVSRGLARVRVHRGLAALRARLADQRGTTNE
jgi:RNA polymerase sigma-70 factor (ECF subfamily)